MREPLTELAESKERDSDGVLEAAGAFAARARVPTRSALDHISLFSALSVSSVRDLFSPAAVQYS